MAKIGLFAVCSVALAARCMAFVPTAMPSMNLSTHVLCFLCSMNIIDWATRDEFLLSSSQSSVCVRPMSDNFDGFNRKF